MKMRRCVSCETYTLKETCPKCNSATENPNPPRFSPQDKYAKYRRMLKQNQP